MNRREFAGAGFEGEMLRRVWRGADTSCYVSGVASIGCVMSDNGSVQARKGRSRVQRIGILVECRGVEGAQSGVENLRSSASTFFL